jgi:hypothetical protein
MARRGGSHLQTRKPLTRVVCGHTAWRVKCYWPDSGRAARWSSYEPSFESTLWDNTLLAIYWLSARFIALFGLALHLYGQ